MTQLLKILLLFSLTNCSSLEEKPIITEKSDETLIEKNQKDYSFYLYFNNKEKTIHNMEYDYISYSTKNGFLTQPINLLEGNNSVYIGYQARYSQNYEWVNNTVFTKPNYSKYLDTITPNSLLNFKDSSFTFNTIIGENAGLYLSNGSFNFIIGEDSTAVNIKENDSYIWYIQPNAKFFDKYSNCLSCLLSVYPYIHKEIPKEKAMDIIENARKCLPEHMIK